MNGREPKLYALLARLPWPKSYLGKIMLSAFLGIHVSLIALVLYLVFAAPTALRASLSILVIVLVATLFGTVLTLYALYALLRPVSLASRALYEYLDSGRLPSLPTNFTDQAGRLMANVQYMIQELDKVFRSLAESATVDHLTDAYNRRAGEQRLASDLARVGRGEGSLTLAVVDLDRFKPQRPLRPPGGGHLPATPRGDLHTQRPRTGLVGKVGWGRVRAGAVGRGGRATGEPGSESHRHGPL